MPIVEIPNHVTVDCANLITKGLVKENITLDGQEYMIHLMGAGFEKAEQVQGIIEKLGGQPIQLERRAQQLEYYFGEFPCEVVFSFELQYFGIQFELHNPEKLPASLTLHPVEHKGLVYSHECTQKHDYLLEVESRADKELLQLVKPYATQDVRTGTILLKQAIEQYEDNPEISAKALGEAFMHYEELLKEPRSTPEKRRRALTHANVLAYHALIRVKNEAELYSVYAAIITQLPNNAHVVDFMSLLNFTLSRVAYLQLNQEQRGFFDSFVKERKERVETFSQSPVAQELQKKQQGKAALFSQRCIHNLVKVIKDFSVALDEEHGFDKALELLEENALICPRALFFLLSDVDNRKIAYMRGIEIAEFTTVSEDFTLGKKSLHEDCLVDVYESWETLSDCSRRKFLILLESLSQEFKQALDLLKVMGRVAEENGLEAFSDPVANTIKSIISKSLKLALNDQDLGEIAKLLNDEPQLLCLYDENKLHVSVRDLREDINNHIIAMQYQIPINQADMNNEEEDIKTSPKLKI